MFIGGTALNMIHLGKPKRYSEDIDLIQLKAAPIKNTMDYIRDSLDPWLGLPKVLQTNQSVKVIYKYMSVNDIPSRVKIEINFSERDCFAGARVFPLKIQSGWFSGESQISSYSLEELMAKKLKALYQRRKGRDLFDLWLVFTECALNKEMVFSIFKKHLDKNNVKILKKDFLENILEKSKIKDFRVDMDKLLPASEVWQFDEACRYIIDQIGQYW